MGFVISFIRRYNKDTSLVFNTMQNYLVSSADRIREEVARVKMTGECLAMKMVRGAYIKEENDLAIKYKYESPVHNSYQATEDNYNSNLLSMLKYLSDPRSKVRKCKEGRSYLV